MTRRRKRTAEEIGGLWAFVILMLLVPRPGAGSLVFDQNETIKGTGLGAVFTTLTIQNSPSESGCVKWNGAVDVVGAPCPGGVAGGDEKPAKSITRTFSEIALTNAANLRVIFNATENDSAIILNNLILTIYSPAGATIFTSNVFTPVDFPDIVHGVGGSGMVFRLDTSQVAAANAAPGFPNPANRIGLAATAGVGSGGQTSSGGPETLFLANVACPAISVSPTSLPTGTVGTPYPATVFSASGGVTPITWTLTGALPTGLMFVDNGNNTATLSPGSQTPTSSGSFPITVTATDANGCTGSVNLLLVINPATCTTPIVVNPVAIPNALIGSFYTQSFSATGGNGGFTFAADLTSAPLGLMFDIPTATLSGTPSQVGLFSVIITATDSTGCVGVRTYSLVVRIAVALRQAPAPVLGQLAMALLALTLAGGALRLISRRHTS